MSRRTAPSSGPSRQSRGGVGRNARAEDDVVVNPEDIVEEIDDLDLNDAPNEEEMSDDDDAPEDDGDEPYTDEQQQWEDASAIGEGDTVEEWIDDSAGGFTEHSEPIYSVAINPANPTMIGTGGGDDVAYLWSRSDGSVIHKFVGHTDSVASVGFNFDGTYFATGGLDGSVKVWNTVTGALVVELDGPDEVEWLSWHPKGNVLLCGSGSGTSFMWQIPSGNVMHIFSGHNSRVTAGGFTSDGKSIVTASEDMSLIAWDPKTAEQVSKISAASDGRFHQEAITSLALSHDNVLVITGGADNKAIITHSKTGKIIASFEGHTDSVESVAFCSTMPWAASGSLDGTACIWDMSANRVRHTLKHDAGVIRVQFHPTLPLLITASLDHLVRVWDARTGSLLQDLHGHLAEPLDICVSNDGSFLISGGEDHHALIFHIQSQAQSQQPQQA
ncbi:hypothetical protein CAOG_00883 [Capsaspora owczarzaki ATCC 30864]|uniref:Uncharacterized protein n=1 Tax=Capsaspora owczarzaki (strain ATCC 30864) TaxID=595528 RepID=A0A0D2X0P3_CAPO3|nr:hypothetical protein CAOG_00883 [Capsaspora owczarzaki ATCC 30864]KJE89409.1 hypothetical protein CAOG_000883 [Capsaspora owczarzaki ATCC 30864]|eukprot:XP_004365754.1 hypothetical protein CAOG_00883 [Capsaspora owczarzaki ATCC 30864]